MNKWTSVEDSLPDVKNPTDMIVWHANGGWEQWRQNSGVPDFYPGITHWMMIEAPDCQVSLWSRFVGWLKA